MLKREYIIDTPRRDIATIIIPVTAHPLKAVTNASFKLLLAALAVLILVLIETHIPTIPANPELNAPKRKDIEVRHPSPVFPRIAYAAYITIASTIVRALIVMYCLFMKASAPILIAFETSRIASVPVSFLRTCLVKKPAKSKARMLIVITTPSKTILD